MITSPRSGSALELTGALEPVLQVHQPNADRNRPIQTIPVLLPLSFRQPFQISLPPLWGATTVLTDPAHAEGRATACCEAFVGAEVSLPVSHVGLANYTPHESVSVRQIEGAARLNVTLEYEFAVVPEPATVLLVVAPLVVVVWRARRGTPHLPN